MTGFNVNTPSPGVAALMFAPDAGQRLTGVPVTLHVAGGRLLVIGRDGQWAFDLKALRLRERFVHAPVVIELPSHGGSASTGSIEIAPGQAIDQLVDRLPARRGLVERWAGSPSSIMLLAVVFAVFLALSYRYVLPPAADQFAQWMPQHYAESIDKAVMEELDKRLLKPSKLPEERRAAISERFEALKLPAGLPQPAGKTSLLFRDAGKEINAFALPGGTIVLTDALVERFNDDAVLGVLGHEIGHVAHRHGLRNLARTTAVGLFFSVYVGDFSAVAATSATFLEQQRYSREAEREADAYAIAVMQENAINPAVLGAFFRVLLRDESGAPPPVFLSSHPAHPERADAFEAAGAVLPPSGALRPGQAIAPQVDPTQGPAQND